MPPWSTLCCLWGILSLTLSCPWLEERRGENGGLLYPPKYDGRVNLLSGVFSRNFQFRICWVYKIPSPLLLSLHIIQPQTANRKSCALQRDIGIQPHFHCRHHFPSPLPVVTSSRHLFPSSPLLPIITHKVEFDIVEGLGFLLDRRGKKTKGRRATNLLCLPPSLASN